MPTPSPPPKSPAWWREYRAAKKAAGQPLKGGPGGKDQTKSNRALRRYWRHTLATEEAQAMTTAPDYSNPASRTDAATVYFASGYTLALDRATLAAQARAWIEHPGQQAHPSRIAYWPSEACLARNGVTLTAAMTALADAGVIFID